MAAAGGCQRREKLCSSSGGVSVLRRETSEKGTLLLHKHVEPSWGRSFADVLLTGTTNWQRSLRKMKSQEQVPASSSNPAAFLLLPLLTESVREKPPKQKTGLRTSFPEDTRVGLEQKKYLNNWHSSGRLGGSVT